MKKTVSYFLLLTILFFGLSTTTFAQQQNYGYDIYEMENQQKKTLRIQKGAFLNAINQREISTQTADEGDIVTFLNPQTMYIDDEIVLPASAIFVGKITTVREPVQGTNGVLKINIFKV